MLDLRHESFQKLLESGRVVRKDGKALIRDPALSRFFCVRVLVLGYLIN